MENLQFFFSQPSLQDAEGEASPDAAVPRNLQVLCSCELLTPLSSSHTVDG